MADRVLVVDFGAQYSQLIARKVREAHVFSELVDRGITAAEIKKLDPVGVILSGGPASVYAEDAYEVDSDIFTLGVPILGICYGHQLLAHGLGGRVASNPRGRQIGTVAVALTAAARDDELLGKFPAALNAQASHTESVIDLPPGATRLALTDLDPNHAFRIGRVAWGVQFHPEFDADIVRGYLAARRGAILEEGIDVDALLRDVAEAADGTAVLRRFADILDT